jgi:hypothetical protein
VLYLPVRNDCASRECLYWELWLDTFCMNLASSRSLYKAKKGGLIHSNWAASTFNCYIIAVSKRSFMRHSSSDTSQYLTFWSLTVTICTTSFGIQQFYVLPTQCIYVFCVDLRTNSDYFTVQHELTGLYNWDGVCLLRGTDWVLKCCLDKLKASSA